MGSVSRLEPSEVKSSLGHISKTKLLNNLDLQFSYSRQRNARACYKISKWSGNRISISSVSSHPPWVHCSPLFSTESFLLSMSMSLSHFVLIHQTLFHDLPWLWNSCCFLTEELTSTDTIVLSVLWYFCLAIKYFLLNKIFFWL